MATRIAILGATGRMGRAIIQAAAANRAVALGAAIERPGHAEAGRDAGVVAGVGDKGIPVATSIEDCLQSFDTLLDFTRPDASLAAAAICAKNGKRMVIGTTGFSEEQRGQLAAFARQVPICMAGNFSIGINLCVALVEQASRTLGEEFDIEIIEAHHRHKVDAPSGTARMLGEAAARGTGRQLSKVAVYERHGHTGARERSTIGFQTVRGGDVVGDHSVLFLGDGERIEITHRASSRLNFAYGAIRAAAWLADQPVGMYSMRDVLS